MSRVRRIVTLFLPAALAGGLLFGSAFGDTAPRIADAGRTRPVPPVPPLPPAPPGGWSQPPPMPGHGGPAGRLSISVHGNKVHIEGLEEFVRQHLEAAREAIRNNPNIPPEAREKALARLDRAHAIVERRLRNLNTTDVDALGDEMEKMGDDIEKAMEGLDEEMEKLGEKLGKDFAKQLGKDLAKGLKPAIRIDRDRDRDHDRAERDADDGKDDEDDRDGDHDSVVLVTPDSDTDADTHGAVRDLPDLTLRPAQREQIARLRSTYEQQIDVAHKQLDDASRRLEVALADPRTSDADISRYVDQVSTYEAAIRKARLLTWVNARRLLDEAQRKKIEDAAGKHHR